MEKNRGKCLEGHGQHNKAAEMIYGVFLSGNWCKSEGYTGWKLNKMISILSVVREKDQERKQESHCLRVRESVLAIRREKSKPWKHFANIEIKMKYEAKKVLEF